MHHSRANNVGMRIWLPRENMYTYCKKKEVGEKEKNANPQHVFDEFTPQGCD